MAKAKKNAAKTIKKTTSKGKIAAKVVKATTKGKAVKVATVVKKAPASKVTLPAVKYANPYRVGGNYFYTVETLKAMGINKIHSFDAYLTAFKKMVGKEFWTSFAALPMRNENGKDAEAKVIQNCSVVARVDYGAPLRSNSLEVRFDGKAKTVGLFKIGK
jgi:hypothetical protein